jgi:hypothetical protein
MIKMNGRAKPIVKAFVM